MVPVLFALAAFLAGYAASEYSARVAGLFAQRGEGIYCVQNCQGAYESWYRHNQEATKSVSPARRIALFGFPTAMTLATILGIVAWRPRSPTLSWYRASFRRHRSHRRAGNAFVCLQHV